MAALVCTAPAHDATAHLSCMDDLPRVDLAEALSTAIRVAIAHANEEASDFSKGDDSEPLSPFRAVTPELEEEEIIKRSLSEDTILNLQPPLKGARIGDIDALEALGFRPVGGVVPITDGKAALGDYCRAQATARPDDEAFYVIDLGVVERQLSDWRRQLPRVEPFYAVKCMGDEGLLATLVAGGAGFDCASPAEIATVQSYGVPVDRIIYANPAKPARHIKFARDAGVLTTTFDSEYELIKLKEHWPEVRCVLRIKSDDPTARCPLGTKYGALPHEVEPLLRAAQRLGLHMEGISFHVGSGATDPKAFSRAIAAARSAFDMAASLGLPPMKLLDIGGGFSGVAANGGVAIACVAGAIADALELHFPSKDVRVISEPGRYFAEPMGTLCTSVMAKRVRKVATAPEAAAEEASEVMDYLKAPDSHEYWLMDGLYGSFNCILYDHASVAARPLFEAGAEVKYHRSTLYGPTCDGLDTIARGVVLPELAMGEWLVFDNMGAYTRAAGSNFNGYDTANITTYYVRSDRA